MMYQCLAEPYTTRNGSQLRIKVDRSAVENLALCFAKSNMLDVNLKIFSLQSGLAELTGVGSFEGVFIDII